MPIPHSMTNQLQPGFIIQPVTRLRRAAHACWLAAEPPASRTDPAVIHLGDQQGVAVIGAFLFSLDFYWL